MLSRVHTVDTLWEWMPEVAGNCAVISLSAGPPSSPGAPPLLYVASCSVQLMKWTISSSIRIPFLFASACSCKINYVYFVINFNWLLYAYIFLTKLIKLIENSHLTRMEFDSNYSSSNRTSQVRANNLVYFYKMNRIQLISN